MNQPNWQHNSGKTKKGRGVAKGRLKSRRQSLQHLKRKLGRVDTRPSLCHTT